MDVGALIGLLSVGLGGLLLVGALFGAYAIGRMQAERRMLDTRDDGGEVATRLQHLERMIEAMSLDMERMAEAQRVATRRLASDTSGAKELPTRV